MSLSIGQVIIVKTPPYYKKQYEYIITAAGEKKILANLKGSPKVKKQWSKVEFDLLVQHKIITFNTSTI